MKLIGISGKMGTGKTTIANMIKEIVPNSERVAFGDVLKRELANKYGVPLSVFYYNKDVVIHATPERREVAWPEARDTMTARELMQWYATEFVRATNPDYWIVGMREYLRSLRGVSLVIIDDTRFPNEAAFIKDSGGVLVRIEPYSGYTVDPGIASHISETALDNRQEWDAVCKPEYGVDSLKKTVDDMTLWAEWD